MKLIKVVVYGFKSFALKTELTFNGGIVGIVGPNGSGKSNINDAIKWVLGEQSTKSLRGDSMEDIIFSGSQTAPPMKTAEVTLIFDNYKKTNSFADKKISITRKLTRGKGENQYFINGQSAKLKDIKEITSKTGMSKSSLAIISQGTISDVAQSTPEEIRCFFEEAAGITKYKSKKTEALRKLEKTSEALDKVRAIVNELKRQLKSLKKQADKAKLYIAYSKELKDIEVGLIVKDVSFFTKKLQGLNVKKIDIIEFKEELETRIEEYENNIKQQTSYKLLLENEIICLNKKLQAINENIIDVEIRNSISYQRRKMIINEEFKSTEFSKKEAIKEQLDHLSRDINQYNLLIDKFNANISKKEKYFSAKETKLTILKNNKNYIFRKFLKLKTKIDILVNNRDNKKNLLKGTKTIIKNKSALSGILDVIADVIKVNSEYNIAIETILQNSLQHIVVNDLQDAANCVEFLKRNNGGSAAFIPLSSIQPKTIDENYRLLLTTRNDVIGIASDFVQVPTKYIILKNFLFGNIIIVKNIRIAINISELLKQKYMVVSIDGNAVHAGGIISFGSICKTKDSLGVNEEISKLKKHKTIIEDELSKITNKENDLLNKISEDRSFILELHVEIAKTKEKANNVQQQYNFLKDRYEFITKNVYEISKKEAISSVNSIEKFKLDKSQTLAMLKAKRNKVISINKKLDQDTLTKIKSEKLLRETTKTLSKNINKKNKAEFYVNSLTKRLTTEYNMTIEFASKKYLLKIDKDKARIIVTKNKKQIQKLGHINVDSCENFKKVNQRFVKLKSSEEELFSARQTILSAINELDKIIVNKFDDTVKATREEFQRVFTIMFDGGHAEIKYTNPNDLLETGINIIAQPPGKSIKNLKLFSGGEKAIIAISLLFAILKSKPLPLCILDEAEAALDESNVLKYVKLLQSLKHKTQFIVVTHSLITMENVDHLFGATMQNRGITSFFTVKLDTAKKMIKN